MPPPGPIVTIERVSYWEKHFDDLMERAVKRIYILRVCKRNGYSASALDYLNLSFFAEIRDGLPIIRDGWRLIFSLKT